MGSGDAEDVRRLRRIVGHVTVSGKTGMKIVKQLAGDRDLAGVDLDPAGYLTRQRPDQYALFPEDWTARQRDLGLSVIRSQGCHVSRGDRAALRVAMTDPVGPEVVRVVSLHEDWLRRPHLGFVLELVRGCDNPLAFVFASVMDPFKAAGALDGFQELCQVAQAGGRRVELLRTDLTGISFAAHGGSLGAIGLTTSTRHHGLLMRPDQLAKYRERQKWPLVFVPMLACWQRGYVLGAVAECAGAGIATCGCSPCCGRSLLRFDRGWTNRVPQEVREDVQAHDVAEWSRLANVVFAASQPGATWARICADASRTAGNIVTRCKMALELPKSLTSWPGSAH